MPAKLTIKNGVAYLSDGVISTRTSSFTRSTHKPIFRISNEIALMFPEVLDVFRDLIYKNVDRRTLAKQFVDTPCWIPRFGSETKTGYVITSKSFTKTHGFIVDGYLHIISHLCSNGIVPEDLVVTHDCKQECCCNPAHLVAATRKKNGSDASRQHDKIKAGAQSWKITANHATLIRFLLVHDILTAKQLSQVFDVSTTAISDILYGVSHPHTDISWLETKGKTYTRLDDDQLTAIKNSGLKHSEIAKILGVHQVTVSGNLREKFGPAPRDKFNLTPARKRKLLEASEQYGAIKRLAAEWGVPAKSLYNKIYELKSRK